MSEHRLTEHLKEVNERFKGKFGTWGYIYQKGHAGVVAPFSLEERKILRGVTRGFHAKVGYCYYNAQTLAVRSDDLKYVEGLMTLHGVPIDHAWLEYNGKVFDPTLYDMKSFKHKQARGDDEYYGMCIPTEMILKNQMQMLSYSPLTQWPSKFAAQLLTGEPEKW